MMLERRKHSRIDADLKIVWAKTDKQAIDNTALSKNISEGGICIIVDEKINAGEILNLKINLSSKNTIQIQGKTAWVSEFPMIHGEKCEEKYVIGIEFINMPPAAREQIKRFVLAIQDQKNKIDVTV